MFLDKILNLIYNQKCVICSCSKTDDLLCKTCAKQINYLSTYAHRIYRNIKIFSCFNYTGIIKKLIQLLKFSHHKKCAVVLGKLTYQYIQKMDLSNPIIIYPPSFFLKSANRGYNHMELIAKELKKLGGFRLEGNLIKKIKYTKPQYSAKNRKKNIQGSYRINEKIAKKLENENFLLLDDITTSGATIEELINCLLDSGIKNITVLTISKAR